MLVIKQLMVHTISFPTMEEEQYIVLFPYIPYILKYFDFRLQSKQLAVNFRHLWFCI